MNEQAIRILKNLSSDTLILVHEELINKSNLFHYGNDGKDDINGFIQDTLKKYSEDISLVDFLINDYHVQDVMENTDLPF